MNSNGKDQHIVLTGNDELVHEVSWDLAGKGWGITAWHCMQRIHVLGGKLSSIYCLCTPRLEYRLPGCFTF